MKLERYLKSINESSSETKIFVRKNMEILDRIHFLLNKKFWGKQSLLAKQMGKTEAEVSKIINGLQNFTQKTIIKLEVAFGEPIQAIYPDGDVEDTTVEYVKPFPLLPTANLTVSVNGRIEDIKEVLEEYNILIS